MKKWYKIPFFWLENARYQALPQSLFPTLLAIAMAYNQDNFIGYLALLCIIGVAFAHLGLNLLDDYFDFKKKDSEIRNELACVGIRARIAKYSYLTDGTVSLRLLLSVAVSFLLLAIIIGIFIFIKRDIWILFFAFCGAFLGYAYSSPPFRLAYKGAGEFIVALVFGPILMGGVFYATSGQWQWEICFISVPVGLLVSNVLYTHSIMDIASDEKLGKLTLARLIKTTNGQLTTSFIFVFFPYIIIFLGVIMHFLHFSYFIVFLSMPLAIGLFYLMFLFKKNPFHTIKPKWWMGPMEQWRKIKKNGIEWFMIRWYLARNLLILFSLLLLIITLFLKK